MPSTNDTRFDSDSDTDRFDSDTDAGDSSTDASDGGVSGRIRAVPTADRRRFLGIGAVTMTAGLAGCAETIGNLIAEFVLDDVNLLNETDRVLTGTITVTGPDDETLLDEEFSLEPADEEADTGDDDSQAVFGDRFETPGEHVFAVTLDGDGIDGERSAELIGEITDPEEEHAVVVLGADELAEPFELFVIEEFTDLGDHIDESAADDEA
ncbi:hypothetical protein [Halorubrum tibetense]|uniref:Uncharacterized protein n=1 Tax=Halorubrum tibetense TaxID=175631 RepID=A0ABD5S7Q8_9EURY